MKKDNYVFISYSSKNQQIADAVLYLLIEEGVPCWMAPNDIPPGSKYAYVINQALENCACLLLLLTNASQESQYVEREVDLAISNRKPIIPMKLEDVELNDGFKFYIGNSQIISVPEVKKDSPQFKRVIEGLKRFVRVDEYMEVIDSQVTESQNKTSDIYKGQIITFGNYEWRVLTVDKNKALLVTKDVITKKAYNEEFKEITWEDCTLRQWLNSEFLNAFSTDEKGKIIDTSIVNKNNPTYSTSGGNDTKDKVFLLSIEEASVYFSSDEDRMAEYHGDNEWWWLRSPGSTMKDAAFVFYDGSISDNGDFVFNNYYGVRPALWITI